MEVLDTRFEQHPPPGSADIMPCHFRPRGVAAARHVGPGAPSGTKLPTKSPQWANGVFGGTSHVLNPWVAKPHHWGDFVGSLVPDGAPVPRVTCRGHTPGSKMARHDIC